MYLRNKQGRVSRSYPRKWHSHDGPDQGSRSCRLENPEECQGHQKIPWFRQLLPTFHPQSFKKGKTYERPTQKGSSFRMEEGTGRRLSGTETSSTKGTSAITTRSEETVRSGN